MMKTLFQACFAAALLLWVALVALAETSVQLEEKADREFELQSFNKAQELYRQAGEQRLVEAKIYEPKKASDDLEISIDDDDDLALPDAKGGTDTKQLDAYAGNYIRAAYDFEKGAKPRRCDECLKKAADVRGVSKKTADELAKLRAFLAERRDPTEHEPPPPKPRVYFRKLNELVAKAEGMSAPKAAPKAIAAAWSEVGYEAFLHHREDVMRRAVDEIAKVKCKPSNMAFRWVEALKRYDNLKTFPKAESETVAPKTLADMGVKEKQTLVAGELDWDAENATKCVEEALASGATTVIFEDRGSPWYVQYIRPRSNQRLVFRKGVRMYMDRVSCQNNYKGALVQLKDVQNVILEGEGAPGDVIISKFPDKASRAKWQNEEGGSGFSVKSCRNVVIRNLTSSWNSCDGIGIGGGLSNGGPTIDLWIENVVFANNYRQGMSACDVAGLYCRNVSFRDTVGGEPMCGIDFEQNYDIEATCDCYFYDCTFCWNVGGAVNWSAGGYFPVTAHLKRCTFLPAPTQHQIGLGARDWSSVADNMRAPAKLVFEDCEMKTHTGSRPFSIRNSNSYDIDIRGFRIKDIGPHKPGKEEKGGAPIVFSLQQNLRRWGRDPVYDFERNEGRIRIEGLVVEGFGDPRPIGFYDECGTYSVTNISGEATVNGKRWDLSQFFYNAPEKGWGLIPKFEPGDYLPPRATSADTPDEAPVAFDLDWRGPWWDPAPEYRALYFQDGAWKVKLIGDNVRELGLEKLPVAYYCRSADSRFRMRGKKKDRPYTVYFELPAGGKPCTLKFRGNGFVKNAKGETVGEFKRWGNKYVTCTPASDASEVWSVTSTSQWCTVWFFAPMSGIIAENPDFLPRHR